MDADIVVRRDRLGRKAKDLIIYPDADVSEPEIDENEDFQLETGLTSESDTDNSEEEPGDCVPSTSRTKKSKTALKWEKRDIGVLDLKFDVTETTPDTVETPVAYFSKYFRNSMFSYITMQTNIYAQQKSSSFSTTSDEVKRYVGILIKMGVYGLPRYRLFWSEDCRVPAVSDVMTRNRFFDLNKYIHFANNEEQVLNREDPRYDRLFKIRPLLEFIRRTCLQFAPQQRQSVDEQIIPFKGKTSLKQYLPKKPRKWGFKVSHLKFLLILQLIKSSAV